MSALQLAVSAALILTLIVAYILIVTSGLYPINVVKKFRIIEKTNGLGNKTYYIQFKAFTFIWHYLRSNDDIQVYNSLDSAEARIMYIKNDIEFNRKLKTVTSKIIK